MEIKIGHKGDRHTCRSSQTPGTDDMNKLFYYIRVHIS